MQDPSTELEEFYATEKYIRKTDKEISNIAKGMYKSEIFTSMQIREEDAGLILNIFLPLAFLDPLGRKQLLIDKITNFYGNVPESGRSVNGYPIMYEVYQLNEEDTNRVILKYKEIIDLLDE